MAIAIGTFRKNVMKTLTPKQAKAGLRLVSKNTQRTNLLQASVNLVAHVGALLQSLTAYILGSQFTAEERQAAASHFGDIGYDLTVLARLLKIKLPSSTKKIKLSGTRTSGLLQLASLSSLLLRVVGVAALSGPKTQTVTKDVVLPNKGGIKEPRQVEVVDVKAEQIEDEERQKRAAIYVTALVDVYWRLSYDIFQQPPAFLFADKLERLKAEHPDVTFDLGVKAVAPVAVPKAPVKAKGKKAEAVPA